LARLNFAGHRISTRAELDGFALSQQVNVNGCPTLILMPNVAAHLPPPTMMVERKNNNRVYKTLRTQSAGGG